jgi:hypothetical protein
MGFTVWGADMLIKFLKVVAIAAAMYGLSGSADLRRQVIGGASAVVEAAAGGVGRMLARDGQRYDTEAEDAARRLGELKAGMELATSDSEKAGLGREFEDTEAEMVAVKADLGNVVRTGRALEKTGEKIASAFSARRGYALADRSTLRQLVHAERSRARDLEAQVVEAKALLAEAVDAGDASKLSRAVELIEDVNAKLASLRDPEEAPMAQR